jgi:Zn-dependent peptidase ImmA (M78 family)/transcriptional regulator with XRE-family HTH domain
MAKNVIHRIDRNLARRLREARREAGLSTRAAATKLPRRLAVSHTTIASYEKGVSVPPIDVLAALATAYERTINWFLEDRKELSEFTYRNLPSRVRVHEKRHFEAVAGKWIDAYVKIEAFLKAQLPKGLRGIDEHIIDPKVLAAAVRNGMGLDDCQPIDNVIPLVEGYGVRVLELRTSLQIDSATAQHNSGIVMIVNPDTSNERLRITVADELARILYCACNRDGGVADSSIERHAYDFACELLLPESQLRKAFDAKSFLKLIEFRERFGISLALMIHRAERSRIIKTTTARWLWMEMSKRGWRHNEPGYVWRDRAIRFETLMESALHSGLLTWSNAENITGIREDELRKRIVDVTDYRNVPTREKEDEKDDVRILKLTMDDV